MEPWTNASQPPKWHLNQLGHFCVHCSKTPSAFEWVTQPQNYPSPWGIWTRSNTWFFGPESATPQPLPNGISIGSTIFAGFTNTTKRKLTAHATLSVAICCILCTECGLIIIMIIIMIIIIMRIITIRTQHWRWISTTIGSPRQTAGSRSVRPRYMQWRSAVWHRQQTEYHRVCTAHVPKVSQRCSTAPPI